MIHVLKKILEPKGTLLPDDLTPEQKKRLYDLFVQNEGSVSTAYNRLFKEGFDKWELIGIDKIKSDFLEENKVEITDDLKKPGAFYEAIGKQRGLKVALRLTLQTLGMNSEVTVGKRFSTDNWKKYELVGVRSIIEQFCKDEQAQG